MKHTAGPWSINELESRAICDVGLSIESEDAFVAGIYTSGTDKIEEEHATARLIRAAPEMYDLLKYFYMNEYCGDHAGEVKNLLNKIDKP